MTDEPKLGRPLECDVARSVRLRLLVTPAEAVALHRRRGDMPMSSWLRRIVLREIVGPAVAPPPGSELERE